MPSTLQAQATPATIAIIGGGFSGSLVATHLLKTATRPLTVTLIERSPAFGQGIAYSTDSLCHLLNVSAGNMSAFPDDPGHLLRWLQHNQSELKAYLPESVNASSFIPRKVYGLYIQSVLAEAAATVPPEVQLERLTDEAVAITETKGKDGIVVLLSGRHLAADKIVLALGNSPAAISQGNGESFLRNGWCVDALDNLDPDGPVLLVGTGLTMVDTVLSLHQHNHQGKIYAVSRRGLFPQRHQAATPYPVFLNPESIPKTVRTLVHQVRAEVKTARAQGYDWRSVIDCLRPITQNIWQRLPPTEQKRFLRHVATYWDVHRHRIAPTVADRLNELVESGQLRITAGRIQSYQALPSGVAVTISQRNTQAETTLQVQRVIRCTGVSVDYRQSTHALITSLRSQGLIRPNPLGLGVDTAPDGSLLQTDGTASKLLYTLGTPRKGDLWETIAVPELRQQAQALAETLLQSLPLRLRSIPVTLPANQGPVDPIDLPTNLLFRQFFDPETSSYTYLIADLVTKEAILVDPVLEQVDRDLQVLQDLQLQLRYCLETHLHADHITGAGQLRQKTGCLVMVPQNPAVTKADRSLRGGEILKLGSIEIATIATPGHTSSHLAYWINKTYLLTGDALLIRGCGRTDFQGGDAGTLYDVVTQRLFTLPEETLVYPAHDYKGLLVSTIGEEKSLNPRFANRSREQFITIMNSLNLNYPKKMNAAVPANEYCGDFIPQNSLIQDHQVEEENKKIAYTVSANTEIYNEFTGMYI